MDWFSIVIYGVLLFAAVAVIGEVTALFAVIGLGYQAVQWLQTGKWPSYTLASQFHLSVDFAPTHWVIIDQLIHFVLFDVEIAFVVLIAVGLASPIREWMERNSSVPARRSLKPSTSSGVVSAATVSSTPVVMSPVVASGSLRRPEDGVLGRLGIFLGWLFNAAALICAAFGAFVFVQGVTSFAVVLLVVAGAVWLFGRGVRYVFAGPTPGPAKQFVERDADPNVPVRLPPVRPAWPQDASGASSLASTGMSAPAPPVEATANADEFSFRSHWGFIVLAAVCLLLRLWPEISSWLQSGP